MIKSLEPKREVNRVLRHRQSKAYFKGGQWTSDPQEAENYADVARAAEACVRYGLNNVEVAVRFQAAKCDLFCTPIR